MKTIAPTLLVPAIAFALLLGGCNAAFVGNLFVLTVTFAIFFGTLQLGRTKDPTASRRADASASVSVTGAETSVVRPATQHDA